MTKVQKMTTNQLPTRRSDSSKSRLAVILTIWTAISFFAGMFASYSMSYTTPVQSPETAKTSLSDNNNLRPSKPEEPREMASTIDDEKDSSNTLTTVKGKNAKEVKVGDILPSITLREGRPNFEKPVSIKLRTLIADKKVAIFGVPGAFTPGCSKSHLPSFIEAQRELKEKGVELTICIATNDSYVMEAWGRTSGGTDAGIRFFSDSKGELSTALGLRVDSDVRIKTRRFSLIADKGKVTHYFSSVDKSSDTWAPKVLEALS